MFCMFCLFAYFYVSHFDIRLLKFDINLDFMKPLNRLGNAVIGTG
jgi:hypothetical protein